MAVRNDFTAGEVLAAADLNDTFAEKVPFAYGTATPTTTVEGFVWYDENDTPPTPKFWDGAAFQALTSGKILQIVRATDSTLRSTTSTSFTDVTGMSVTISPTKTTSAVIVVATGWSQATNSSQNGAYGYFQLTDNSNNELSGAESILHGGFNVSRPSGAQQFYNSFAFFGYSTPATTSATTYKMRFKVDTNNTIRVENATATGQMYALEISA
jgi:hypothetical protein